MVAASGLGKPPPQPAREEGMLGLSPPVVAVAAEESLSDAETASSSSTTAAGGAPNSSLSSGSSSSSGRSLARCSSCLSRLSFSSSPSASLASPARPHRSSDPAWAAIRAASLKSPLGPADFKLVRRVGGGDIGTVYLCRLLLPHGGTSSSSPPCVYAMKVVDRRRLAGKKKPERERRILRRLDHPFLPTLFADFDAAPHLSCAVTEFCPGGDLHSLLLRRRRLPLPSARFYAAEVLAALEYLHMMGIVYRDLKPENVLIRADGHVMLTDFDLSLQSSSSPFVLDDDEDEQPATSCFPRRRRKKREPRMVVAEPVAARSRSLVGTHEYVAPEVASGGTHGAAVDWWALGVLLYELLHGRTPFAGADNEATLRNVVSAPLAFPPSGSLCGGAMDAAMADARDLIARLLAKDPAARLGARRGAADVKAHRFFRGVNFALLRSARPPLVPSVPGGGPVRRSQSCKAPPRPEPGRFDLF
ncbi:protein kinase PINOID [Brachypodium distachyon]|uniref:non-specific serine/threonine protein kinase n=1 Tax=Brachypodium distachyon TaxID=15368 RepID=I1IGF4_BRADI|nr:protein kinase PINOID [Brachypodium distachyon]KQJ85787.1 hypothetical protein BRADI_4g01700v3 [Brachypodium distachyon]|eukprot:XP_010238859.1 protein kinase PINOID [Brachypodium distachyon]